MSRIRTNPPGVDPRLLIKDAAKLMPAPTRRLFLRGGASLGALAFLSGCDIIDGPSAEQALTKISYLNDRAQAWLFNPNKLAPTYPESAITRPFPFNGYYPEDEALTTEAALYVQKYQREKQLLDFYSKTIQQSPRDYRWSMALARMQSSLEDYPAAIDAYGKSIAIRPDRTISMRSASAMASIIPSAPSTAR